MPPGAATSLPEQEERFFQVRDQSLDWVREWSLITGRGGATKREGGAREVLPLRKGGAEKVLAILKGGHKKFWGRFYAVA